MKRLRNHMLGIAQGDLVMFSDFEHDGKMWTGEGPRSHVEAVKFTEKFRSVPAVHVSLSMWDTSNLQNPRMDIRAENISREGFDLVFRTWGDSKVARVRAAWLAIGELSQTDDWDLY